MIMKKVTIKFTHNEVFEEFTNQMVESDSKYITTIKNNDDDDIVVNITGTLEELENE